MDLYEAIHRRVFMLKASRYREGFFVVYFTYTGNIRTSSQWMVPGTHPDDPLAVGH